MTVVMADPRVSYTPASASSSVSIRSLFVLVVCLLFCFFPLSVTAENTLGLASLMNFVKNPFTSGITGFMAKLSDAKWEINASDTVKIELPVEGIIASLLPVTHCDLYYNGVIYPTTTVTDGDNIYVKIVNTILPPLIPPIEPLVRKGIEISCIDVFGSLGNGASLAGTLFTLQSSKTGQSSSVKYMNSETIPNYLKGAVRAVSHSTGIAGTTGDMSWSIRNITGPLESGSKLVQRLPDVFSLGQAMICTINEIIVQPVVNFISGYIQITVDIPDILTGGDTEKLELKCSDVTTPLLIDPFKIIMNLLNQIIQLPNGESAGEIPGNDVTDITKRAVIGKKGDKEFKLSTTVTSTKGVLEANLLTDIPIPIKQNFAIDIKIPYEGVFHFEADTKCTLSVSPSTMLDVTLMLTDISVSVATSGGGFAMVTAIVKSLGDNKDTIMAVLRSFKCSPVVSSRFTHSAIGDISVTARYGDNIIGLGADFTISPIKDIIGIEGDLNVFTSTNFLGDLVKILLSIPKGSFKAGDVLELIIPDGTWGLNYTLGGYFGNNHCGVLMNFNSTGFDIDKVKASDFIPSIDLAVENNSVMLRFPTDYTNADLGVYCRLASNPLSDVFTTITKIPGAIYNLWDKTLRPVGKAVLNILFKLFKFIGGAISNIVSRMDNNNTGNVVKLSLSIAAIDDISLNEDVTPHGVITHSTSTPAQVNLVSGSVIELVLPPQYSFLPQSVCDIVEGRSIIPSTTTIVPFSDPSKLLTFKAPLPHNGGTTYHSNFNLHQTIGLGRQAVILVSPGAVSSDLTGVSFSCTHLALPSKAQEITENTIIRVFNPVSGGGSRTEGEDELSTPKFEQVAFTTTAPLPSVSPSPLQQSILTISSTIPATLASMSLSVPAISNRVSKGDQIKVILPLDLAVPTSNTPSCVVQVRDTIILGQTSVQKTKIAKVRSIVGLSSVKLTNKNGVMTAGWNSKSNVSVNNVDIKSQKNTQSLLNDAEGDVGATVVVFTANDEILADSAVNMVCGGFIVQNLPKIAGSSTLMWTDTPADDPATGTILPPSSVFDGMAAMDVSSVKIVYSTNTVYDDTVGVIGHAAMIHNIAIKIDEALPMKTLNKIETSYKEVLNGVGVRVTVMRQILSRDRALDKSMLTMSDASRARANAVGTLSEGFEINMDALRVRVSEEGEEALVVGQKATPLSSLSSLTSLTSMSTLSGSSSSVLLISTRVIAEKSTVTQAELSSALHKATALLAISAAIESHTQNEIYKVYSATDFNWPVFMSKCMDPPVCGGDEFICIQCADRDICKDDVDCFSNNCNKGVCVGVDSSNSSFAENLQWAVVSAVVLYTAGVLAVALNNRREKID